MAATKTAKSKIVNKILAAVKEENPEEGIFVKQVEPDSWWEVEDAIAREKVGCIIRDCLHLQYRSSTKAKLRKRKAAEQQQQQQEGNKVVETEEVGKSISKQQRNRQSDDIDGSAERKVVRLSAHDTLSLITSSTTSDPAVLLQHLPPGGKAIVDTAFIHSNSNPFWGRGSKPATPTQPQTQYGPIDGQHDSIQADVLRRHGMLQQEAQPGSKRGSASTSGFIAERLPIRLQTLAFQQPGSGDVSIPRFSAEVQDFPGTYHGNSMVTNLHTEQAPGEGRPNYHAHHEAERDHQTGVHGDLPDDISGIFDD